MTEIACPLEREALAQPALRSVTPQHVRTSWILKREIALLDLRGEHVHAQGHPLFATSLPLGMLEMRILDAVPRKDTPIVLLHDDERITRLAADVLAQLDYSNVAALAGGHDGWRAAGFESFEDVNSPSKAFGELVAEHKHTPFVSARELGQLIEQGHDLAILDARTFAEYRTMSIPTAMSMPGADLVRNAGAALRSSDTRVIVNCAGRTRSIIGAQSLINAGFGHQAAALRNGTIGWLLEDMTLERGAQQHLDSELGGGSIAAAASWDVAYRAGVRRIEGTALRTLATAGDRTTYRFDLRPASEFAQGHVPDFRNVEGGQLVQETEAFAPVRGARIVLYDDAVSARANMTASWLAQMGWDCLVLLHEPAEETATGERSAAVPSCAHDDWIEAEDLAHASGAVLIELGPSTEVARGHIPGSVLVPRDRLADFLATRSDDRAVLISNDGRAAAFAAAGVGTGTRMQVLRGGRQRYVAGGLPLADGPPPSFGPVDDVYRRPYVGTDASKAAMQAYLDWEYGLVAQLARDGSHGFFVI